MSTHFLLKKPVVSEKAFTFTAKGKYVFMVEPHATKPEVRKAIQKLYSVHVTQVNIVRLPGKPKRAGAKYSIQGAHKKAIVTVRKGETIDIAR